jgi:predicted metal-dependent HD superfamily phosphohydrolase
VDSLRRWGAFWEAAGAAGDTRGEHDALCALYAEPGRFYHTLDHVLSCLEELDRAGGGRGAAAEAALWFHDAVYDPRAADNEARSAELVREAVRRMGAAPGLGEGAAVLVMATAHGAGGAPAAGDAALVRDIDLAVLGRPPARYEEYRRAVRREYSFLGDGEWRDGRSAVLRRFLSEPRIYVTEALGSRLEVPARVNLRAELEALSSGGKPPAMPATGRPR